MTFIYAFIKCECMKASMTQLGGRPSMERWSRPTYIDGRQGPNRSACQKPKIPPPRAKIEWRKCTIAAGSTPAWTAIRPTADISTSAALVEETTLPASLMVPPTLPPIQELCRQNHISLTRRQATGQAIMSRTRTMPQIPTSSLKAKEIDYAIPLTTSQNHSPINSSIILSH